MASCLCRCLAGLEFLVVYTARASRTRALLAGFGVATRIGAAQRIVLQVAVRIERLAAGILDDGIDAQEPAQVLVGHLGAQPSERCL